MSNHHKPFLVMMNQLPISMNPYKKRIHQISHQPLLRTGSSAASMAGETPMGPHLAEALESLDLEARGPAAWRSPPQWATLIVSKAKGCTIRKCCHKLVLQPIFMGGGVN